MRKIALVVTVSFLTSNCAAMFHGTKETIHVRSNEAETIFYMNEREIGKGTSAVTTIPKKKLGNSTLRATKSDCLEKTSPIETEFDAITLLGIPLDYGIFSILLIDWGATGAVTKASQTDYVITPECKKG